MILLFDIGNTHTHVGLADVRKACKYTDLPTKDWFTGKAATKLVKFVGRNRIAGTALCSVVPRATPRIRRMVRTLWKLPCLELTPATLRGVGIDYPRPGSIGPDRLAIVCVDLM